MLHALWLPEITIRQGQVSQSISLAPPPSASTRDISCFHGAVPAARRRDVSLLWENLRRGDEARPINQGLLIVFPAASISSCRMSFPSFDANTSNVVAGLF